MEREVGKFMRKWICILLAAGIAAGLMSGCSRNVGTQESAVWQLLETEGGLTAASAGIAAALVFGYLGALVFKPKMKE